MRTTIPFSVFLAALAVTVAVSANEKERITVSLAVADYNDKAAQIVADPAAENQKALAIKLGANQGKYELKASPRPLEAGLYRVTFYIRLRHAPGDDISRLLLEVATDLGKGPRHKEKQNLVWTQFDSTADRYTPFEMEMMLPAACSPTFEIGWLQTFAGTNVRSRPIHEVEVTTEQLDAVVVKPKTTAAGDDLLGEIKSENSKGAPLDSVNYPVVLMDRVTFEPISRTQWIDSVHPQFLHVYPGGANPVEAKFRNLEDRSVEAVAQLEIRTGLNEVLHTASQPVTLSPQSSTACRFEWTSGKREFGHEARVTLMVNGQPIHTASEYFSVSASIWKTALQGSGFLTWYGREKEFPGHVAHCRETYLNVEEAFSWQPSSWTDLNPKTDDWWSGQGNAHNSLAGLKKWIGLSHEQGIKMITYLWPTASGPEGMEWVRQNPEQVIFGGGNFDVEDLRLAPITAANPRLWRMRGGVWNHIYVNRGMLRGVEKGVAETIASAKAFGWDGARFDKPPGWGRTPAEQMHAEFKHLKVEDLMQRLIPEYYSQTTGIWEGEAVTICNYRYVKHRFHEYDPHFALSYNGAVGNGAVGNGPGGRDAALNEAAAGGGQGMNEAMRLMTAGPWRNYLMRAREEADIAHQRGGFHCTVKPDSIGSVLRCFSGISVLIAGSHPYGDFGWSTPMPGFYSQFVTRYGEYCWSQDLKPVTANDTAAFTVTNDKAIWWRDLMKHRKTDEGGDQWVVHLFSDPPAELMAPKKPGTMTPWNRGLAVSRQTIREPEVWALSAEPSIRATRLPTRQEGDRFVVDVPEHHVWTMVVWTEPK